MPARKTLLALGSKGDADRVRVLEDSARDRVVVQYRDGRQLARKKFFPADRQGKKDALEWARAFYDERRARGYAKPETTHAELWKAYSEAPAFTEALRDKTRIAYESRFKRWMTFRGAHTLVDDTTLLHVDRFYAEAKKNGMALNQIRQVLNVARVVYNWGQSRKLVRNNELALYRWKTPKDAPKIEPAEYSTEEYDKLLPQFDPRRGDQWRAWVALMLLGHHGMRINAVRNLRWQDIDYERGVIVWPAKYQKQGVDVTQPITWTTHSALLVARHYAGVELQQRAAAQVRGADGKWAHDASQDGPPIETPFVLFAQRKPTTAYSYSSFHSSLQRAEKGAKIEHKKYRGAHGFRKMVVGNVIEATGDRMLGLEFVGDTDVKMLKHYDKRSQERIDRASAAMEEKK
jgi:integrase